jgi:hypothetical protein
MIVLQISFHTTRTLPLSDICKKINYIQIKNVNQGLLQIEYTIYNETDTLQQGKAIVTPTLSSIPLSKEIRDPAHLYTVLRIDAMTPRPFTEEPYELSLVLTPGKN